MLVVLWTSVQNGVSWQLSVSGAATATGLSMVRAVLAHQMHTTD